MASITFAPQAAAEYGATTSAIGSRLSQIWRNIEGFASDNPVLVIGGGIALVLFVGWLTRPRLR